MREGLGAELGAQRNHAGRQVPTWESLLAEAGERRGLRSLALSFLKERRNLTDTHFPPREVAHSRVSC